MSPQFTGSRTLYMDIFTYNGCLLSTESNSRGTEKCMSISILSIKFHSNFFYFLFLKYKMRVFFKSFAKLYPCSYCANHFRGEIKKFPPAVESNKDLSRWLCEIHNEVNERLGKPQFDCSRVLERWKEGPKGDSVCR